ncbi:MAG: methyltransferase domain-containing protein [Candidatus Thiodiazotropha sp.]|jgi:tellurite methyltransferase
MAEPSLRAKWDARHGDLLKQPSAAEVLAQNRHLLPARGRALDLACGLGGNALVLAEQGLEVTAWDFSPVAIQRLRETAGQCGLRNLLAEVRDLEQSPPPAQSFDVIVVSYYLDRGLVPHIIVALKPGGLLFYQTFTRIAVSEEGPSNPDYRLGDNELLQLFGALRPRVYREENLLGDLARGTRDVAMLVAQRVASDGT